MTVASVVAWVVLAGGLGQAAVAPPEAESKAERPWGSPKVGLQISMVVQGDVTFGKTVVLALALKNVGSEPIQVSKSDSKKPFAWLLVQQGARKFTEKVPLAEELAGWVKSGQVIHFKPMDLSAAKVYEYKRGMKVLGGYLIPPQGETMPPPIGTLSQKLAVGSAKALMMLYLPREGEPAQVLVSNPVEILVRPPKLSSLSPEAREAFVRQLMAKFQRSAWAGQAAHHQCVQIGPEIVPDLIAALKQPNLPPFASAWMVTALCDIRDPRAAAELVRIMSAPGGLHPYIAYHGPKQRSAELDRAIVKRVAEGKGTHVTALATLGFLGARGVVPEAVLKAGLDSDDPRVRGTVAESFQHRAGDENVFRAIALLKDKDEQVRAVAARVLGHMVAKTHERSTRVARALIEALDDPSEYVKQRVCGSLSKMMGKDLPYDPAAAAAVRAKTIAAWKAWWASLRKARHEGAGK